MNVFIQNSQKAMSYMLNVFQIMEHHWINIYDQMAENPNKKKANPAIDKANRKVDTNTPKSSASKKPLQQKVKQSLLQCSQNQKQVKRNRKSAVQQKLKQILKSGLQLSNNNHKCPYLLCRKIWKNRVLTRLLN